LAKTKIIYLLFCFFLSSQIAFGQNPDTVGGVVDDGGGLVFEDEYEPEEEEGTKLIVGLMVDPPFVIKDTDGSYYGLSIDLWNFIVDELDLQYEFQEFNDETAMLRKLNFNELDISINPTKVNSNRVRMYSATQPFFISSLGIATSSIPQNQFQMFISNIFSFDFLKIILGLMLIIILFGSIVWYVESRKNNVEFGRGAKGLLDGIWWAAVTMTTVGYGDKTPRSLTGRMISIVWMFSGIITISSLTASITSQLTVNTLGMDIERIEDLKKVNRIGTVRYSSSEEYLMDHKIKPKKKYDSPVAGMEALSDGEIDVFVYDKPIMNYLITKNELENRVRVMPITFNRNYCSFMLPGDSKMVNEINPILLDKISIASWANTLEKYNLDQGE
jgi:polar amino acid transport system substrate-binding protein